MTNLRINVKYNITIGCSLPFLIELCEVSRLHVSLYGDSV